MAKFEIMVTEHVQRSVSYTATITKKQVVEALGLEGDDAKQWKDHVHDYVESNWEELRDKAEQGDIGDEAETQFDIDSVTNLDDA